MTEPIKRAEEYFEIKQKQHYDNGGYALGINTDYRKNFVLDLMESFANLRVRESCKATWISVDDRLPEKRQDVLWSCIGDKKIYHERYLVDMLEPYYVTEYTHWQPLPEPPSSNKH